MPHKGTGIVKSFSSTVLHTRIWAKFIFNCLASAFNIDFRHTVDGKKLVCRYFSGNYDKPMPT